MKNRNLFIQLNLPEEKDFKQTLVNSWTKPIPMEFHLINSPSLTDELSHHVPKENIRHTIDQPAERGMRYTIKRISKERKKYMRLEEELQFLQQFLTEFKDLHESQLLVYKQTLLVKYLNNFLEEISTECHEKSNFLRLIWNTLIKIFQELFERVVSQSRKKQRSMLSGQIHLHQQYQKKLEELHQHNQVFIKTETQYKGAINQLMESVAIVNMELKGTKTLQQKSASTIRTLSQKYEELKADYLDIVVSTGVSRAEAERNLNDKEMLLFSKQVAHNQLDVKVKQKPGRKARIINEKIDVGLILQEIDAEDDFEFELDSDEKKEVKYSNQKVQTEDQQPVKKADQYTQSTVRDLLQLKIIRDKGVQTVRKDYTDNRMNVKIQTDEEEKSKKPQLSFATFCGVKILPSKENAHSNRSSMKQLKRSSHEAQFSEQMLNHLSQALRMTEKRPETSSMYLTKSVSSVAENEKKPIKKSRQGKMFRVGESSRFSKMPQSRLKTEGGHQTENTASDQRSSQTKKISEFILLEEVRKKIVGKWSKFRESSTKNNFFVDLKSQISKHLEHTSHVSSIVSTDNAAISKPHCFLRNTQVRSFNEALLGRICEVPHGKRVVAAGKTIKIVAEILQEFNQFISDNVYCFDVVSFSVQYLSALKGQYLEKEAKERVFIQFIRTCAPLAVNSYLVRNFLLLCGIPFNKAEYRNSKLSIKLTQQDEDKAAKFMYSSEVLAYFRLLSKANCDTTSNLMQAYTNVHVMLDSLQYLKMLYKDCNPLLSDIQASVRKSIDVTGEADPKLDIFKTLHFVLEKILQYKQKISQKLEPLSLLYGQMDHQFFDAIVSLLTQNPTNRIVSLKLFSSSYGGISTLQNISSLILIEGFQLDLLPFVQVEAEYRFTILKKLLSQDSSTNSMINGMLKAVHKKELKKTQFLCLLRLIWTQNSEEVCEEWLGEDLNALYTVTISQTLQRPSMQNFHSIAFGG